MNNLGTYSEAEEKLKKLNLQQYVLTTDSELDVETASKSKNNFEEIRYNEKQITDENQQSFSKEIHDESYRKS